MSTQSFKDAQKKYRDSPKGKETLRRYHQTDKFREVQKRYQNSDKAKANRKAKPEIYMRDPVTSLNKMRQDMVCKILINHVEGLQDDPERFSTEYICNMARIEIEEDKPVYYVEEV
jgi:hypothetical protein